MSDTLIKICGITRIEDARSAVDAGANALGFIFYPPSPRYIDPDHAQAIIKVLPPFVTTVGVFVNQGPEEVARFLDKAQVNLLQLHGDEDPELCRSYDHPYIKSLRVKAVEEAGLAAQYPDARGILLDTLVSEVYGGSGEAFAWQRLPSSVTQPVILAGGLNADNVSKAIRLVRPYGVDVSTGVEIAKGIKDEAKITEFVAAVRSQPG